MPRQETNSVPGEILALDVASIREIRVHSSWTGLGPHDNAAMTIRRVAHGFTDGKRPLTDAEVGALLDAIKGGDRASDVLDLGVDEAWLEGHAAEARRQASGYDLTKAQKQRFMELFADPSVIHNVIERATSRPESHTDDYPHVRVEIVSDRISFTLESESQSLEMSPWKMLVGSQATDLRNSRIGAALGRLMPAKFPNRDRFVLSDAERLSLLVSSLAREVQAGCWEGATLRFECM
jgi:hypothetical protein